MSDKYFPWEKPEKEMRETFSRIRKQVSKLCLLRKVGSIYKDGIDFQVPDNVDKQAALCVVRAVNEIGVNEDFEIAAKYLFEDMRGNNLLHSKLTPQDYADFAKFALKCKRMCDTYGLEVDAQPDVKPTDTEKQSAHPV